MPYAPSLALATGTFEIAAGLWIITGPGRKAITRPVSAILFLLAGYQILEAMLCQHGGDPRLARLAFADITWLPAVGVLLVERLAGARRRFSPVFLAAATALTGWILLDPGFVARAVCKVVIATYDTPSDLYAVYGGYYQLGLFTMIVAAGYAMAGHSDGLARRHLADVQIGTVAFVFPAMLTELVVAQTGGSQPSLMCHYAAFLAISLVRLGYRERAHALGDAPEPLWPWAA